MVKVQCPGTPDSIDAYFGLQGVNNRINGGLTENIFSEEDKNSLQEEHDNYDFIMPEPPEVPIKLSNDNHAGENTIEPELFQNVPNPFSESTSIKFRIKEACRVKLYITDLTGNFKMLLLDDERNAGEYTINVNNDKLANGFYIYTLEAFEYKLSKKLQIIK